MISVRTDYDAGMLRELAARSKDASQSRRLLSLAGQSAMPSLPISWPSSIRMSALRLLSRSKNAWNKGASAATVPTERDYLMSATIEQGQAEQCG